MREWEECAARAWRERALRQAAEDGALLTLALALAMDRGAEGEGAEKEEELKGGERDRDQE